MVEGDDPHAFSAIDFDNHPVSLLRRCHGANG